MDEQYTRPGVSCLRMAYGYNQAIKSHIIPTTVSAVQPMCTIPAMRDETPHPAGTNAAPGCWEQLHPVRHRWGTPLSNRLPPMKPKPSCTGTSEQETDLPSTLTHVAFETYMSATINAGRSGHTGGVTTPTRRQQDKDSNMYVQLKTPTDDTPTILSVLPTKPPKGILRMSHDRSKKHARTPMFNTHTIVLPDHLPRMHTRCAPTPRCLSRKCPVGPYAIPYGPGHTEGFHG